MKKGQTYSLDIILAVGVFVVAITFLFIYVGTRQEAISIEELEREGEYLTEVLRNSPNKTFVIIESGNKINKKRLDVVANLSYSEIKQGVGVRSDFCVYLEDRDGNLVNVTGNLTGFGSPAVNISGYRCGR